MSVICLFVVHSVSYDNVLIMKLNANKASSIVPTKYCPSLPFEIKEGMKKLDIKLVVIRRIKMSRN